MSQPTERQSPSEQDQARDLSLQRTSPPCPVPGYEMRRFLGSGAYGEVWVGTDRVTGRQVAVKFYTHHTHIDPSLLSREVEKLVFLSADRYVVQVLDVGWLAKPPYYVMEYMEHGSLAEHLERTGTLSVPHSVDIFRDVTIGLLHAHQKGVLHCDLKPANILLDHDFKPRLADFGQSRLSHEQTPALGTLFYMAPEQADLTAIPDARWDVYGLGALLFCMLTGQPPHRQQIPASELDSMATLSERLETYRNRIRQLPPLSAHRRVRGIDRSLINIIDRCLAIDPDQRYANVQSVLDALEIRDRQRSRRPLLVLGFVGPLLLLTIGSLFGWQSYQRSLRDSSNMLTRRALESNQFAAKFVAEAVARRFDRYFREVEQLAVSAPLRATLSDLLSDPQISSLLEALAEPGGDGARDTDQLQQLIQHSLRRQLEQQLIDRLQAASDLKVASWFVVDRHGVQIAAAYQSNPTASQIGTRFAYRTYFHGGLEDLEPGAVATPPRHIEATHLSTVFQSTATQHWKVAVSTPVTSSTGAFLGVLALTVDLGSVVDFREFSPNLFTVLVDGREGDHRGVILEHPLLKSLVESGQPIPSHFQRDYRVQLDDWPTYGWAGYVDPLGTDPLGSSYRRRWIAAQQPVTLNKPQSPQQAETPTGLVVIVQEDYGSIEAPISQLGQWLTRQGLLALTTFAAVVVLLWYSVLRLLKGLSGPAAPRPAATQSSAGQAEGLRPGAAWPGTASIDVSSQMAHKTIPLPRQTPDQR